MPTPRPPRLRITDELGRVRTLDAGPESRVRLTAALPKAPLLILGAGPEPATFCQSHAQSRRPTFWLDSPNFVAQMPSLWSVPPHWQRIEPTKLKNLLFQAEIWQYRAGPALFPSFWGSILGELAAGRLFLKAPHSPDSSEKAVILPRTTLMHRELTEAFAAHGLQTRSIPSDPAEATAATLEILRNETVALFLSLNFEGLDAGGGLFHLLRAQNIPVAAWLVDNPWHILSRIQQPWWRGVRLFVTDASFVEPLHDHGAEQVFVLPLAAWNMPVPDSAASPSPLSSPSPLITFVGHSTFPQRERFFSGLTLPDDLWTEALSLLDTETPPNLLWWQRRLNTTTQWPGLGCRLAGLGAERASLERRTRFLQACLPLGLSIYGDNGWSEQLASLDCPIRPPHPPVDYYSALGMLYAQSRYTLNVTSLQLPAGLTQRHFDVWQTGGFLLTDHSSGLSLFPRELTEPISAARPSDIPNIVSRLERDATLRHDLMAAWQAHIREKHTYFQRVEQILQYLS